jgi:hypothetical protein
MIFEPLIQHGICSVFNVANAFLDAYKIKVALGKNIPRAVRHGINFVAYAICVASVWYLYHMTLQEGITYAVSAFFNRQLFFDIPLNLRRGKKWDYVSLAKPPKAIMDRIEVWMFGYDGRTPIFIYAILWLATLIVQMVLH